MKPADMWAQLETGALSFSFMSSLLIIDDSLVIAFVIPVGRTSNDA